MAPVLVLFHWLVSQVEKVSGRGQGESPDRVSVLVRKRHCFPHQMKSSLHLLSETPSLKARERKKDG